MRHITEILGALGIERGAAARGIGVSRSTLWRITEGRLEPTRRIVLRILAFLNRPEHLKKLGRRKPFTFEELFAEDAVRVGGRAS